MKATCPQAARTDVTRQFRYYLVQLDLPLIAVGLKAAIVKTVEELKQASSHRDALPSAKPGTPQSPDLARGRVQDQPPLLSDVMCVIRILPGKQDVRATLERERPSED